MTDSTRQMGDSNDIHRQRTAFAPQQAENSGEHHGTYEPDDSRNVTGAGGSGVGAPGGSDQQAGAERWGRQDAQSPDSSHQAGETYGENTAADQQGSFDRASDAQFGEIREHMEVIGADGVHLGTVDRCEGDRIKLTKADSGMGSHEGHHHYISRGLVAGVEGDQVRLSATAANAYALEEEE